MRRCYIIIRQIFYVSKGLLYQCVNDNPVIDVSTTAEAAQERARSLIELYIKSTKEPLHMVEETPDSELIYKVGAFDSLGRCKRCYCVIKKGMMV